MSNTEKLLNEYAERFNENFPLYAAPPMTDKEFEKVLMDCLKSDKPYELDEETKRLMEDPTVDF